MEWRECWLWGPEFDFYLRHLDKWFNSPDPQLPQMSSGNNDYTLWDCCEYLRMYVKHLVQVPGAQ